MKVLLHGTFRCLDNYTTLTKDRKASTEPFVDKLNKNIKEVR